jgi:putative acetyltransferase
MEIRTYQEKDKENVIRLILNIQQKEFNVPIRREDQPDLEIIPSYYQENSGNFWVVILNEELIGTVALIDFGDNKAALRKMFVKKEFRGKELEIATKLFNKAIQWCGQNQINSIYLGTIKRLEAAIRFYKRKGFKEIDKNDLPVNFPRMEIDTQFFEYYV